MKVSKEEAISRNQNKYFTGKPCKRGHVSERYTSNSDCVTCSTDRAMGVHSGTPIEEVYRKAKERRSKNIDQYLASERRYYEKNAEKIRAESRDHYWKNKEACNQRSKKWRDENKDAARKLWNKHSKIKRSSPEGKLITGLRARISAMVSKSTKSKSAKEYLGCEVEEFRSHLEALFSEGMSWDNYGLEGWHIDHIRPLSSFDLSNEDDIKKAFHYSNTQPLWAEDNLKKAAKWQA